MLWLNLWSSSITLVHMSHPFPFESYIVANIIAIHVCLHFLNTVLISQLPCGISSYFPVALLSHHCLSSGEEGNEVLKS